MRASKKGKLQIKVKQVDGSGTYFMAYEVLQENQRKPVLIELQALVRKKLSSDKMNNIVLNTMDDQIVQD